MRPLKSVLIMAGGTGGHVFPGLALADYFRDRGVAIDWLGTATGLEARIVPQANIPLHSIDIQGVRGKGVLAQLLAPWRITKAISQARMIINEIKPDVAIGMGGFASGPGGLACCLSKRPLIIHEQNAVAGFTNKQLARFATYICEGFPGAFKPASNVVVTGNPVRRELLYLLPPRERLAAHPPTKHLLVLGGSLGARTLNQIVPDALAQLSASERPTVLHQTGEKHVQATQLAYQAADVTATIVPFIDDMASAYAAADMILCRAGALTIAELCAVGLGGILVPFPHAVDDHQTANAQFMAHHGAAMIMQEAALTTMQLAATLRDLSHSDSRCLEMAQAAYQLREERVAEHIFNLCEEVCH